MLHLLRGGEASHEGEGRLPALLLETRASYPPSYRWLCCQQEIEQDRKEFADETTKGATDRGGDGARGARA